ncbi:hypothetical protein HDU76_011912 [Blyttiomyces sp. JEL0837]|nr:hypothetical protein HDU76_011912 [Blyttiomyces sp. JEL0837]
MEEYEEEYRMTYPWASINGWLSGKPYITVSESCVVECKQTGLKCVLLYKEEPYFTSPRFAIDGKVVRWDFAAESADKKGKKGTGEGEVLATIYGAWNGKMFAAIGSEQPRLFFDLQASNTFPKQVAPLSLQSSNESRKLWSEVSHAIVTKDYNTATVKKREIEDRQRKLAGERKESGIVFVPELFEFKVPVGGHHHHKHHEESVGMEWEKGKPYPKEGVLEAFENS